MMHQNEIAKLKFDDIINFVNYELDAIKIEKKYDIVCGFIFSLHREIVEKYGRTDIFEDVSYAWSFDNVMRVNDCFTNLILKQQNNKIDIIRNEDEITYLSKDKFEIFQYIMREWIDEKFAPEEYAQYFKDSFETFLVKYEKRSEYVENFYSNGVGPLWLKFNNDMILSIIHEIVDNKLPEKVELLEYPMKIPMFIEDFYQNVSNYNTVIAVNFVIMFLCIMFTDSYFFLAYFSISVAALIAQLAMKSKSKQGKFMKTMNVFTVCVFTFFSASTLGWWAITAILISLMNLLIFTGVINYDKSDIKKIPFL